MQKHAQDRSMSRGFLTDHYGSVKEDTQHKDTRRPEKNMPTQARIQNHVKSPLKENAVQRGNN